MSLLKEIKVKTSRRLERMVDLAQPACMALQVALRAFPCGSSPVIFFNASTRINALSLNAGFSLLTSWAVRLEGVPVVHFVCHAGMSHCIMGTDPNHLDEKPPCKVCIRESRFLYIGARTRFFHYQHDAKLAETIRSLPLDELVHVTHNDIPLGQLVLPGLRWRLRLHHLQNDERTGRLYREFILSAWNVADEFSRLLDEINPRAVVLFNGQFFPEAVARFLSLRRGVRVITHEVGLQPFSAYFTTGEATAYPIRIQDEFELSPAQNARLDAYLEKRFQGKFSMAGIHFWPEMKGLDKALLKKLSAFRQVVPVFTNVIFDTSQPHSNVVFPDMFTWLDMVLETIKRHPETLFIIRAHPDETRPGKAARESVAEWVARTRVVELANVLFVPADEYFSSYELIQRAKFVMIYNSTIGLEASIMGVPVLCAGKARFTQYPTVHFPDNAAEYRTRLEDFLNAGEVKAVPEHQHHARRFLYYQLFRTSMPFNEFLEASGQQGYVRIKKGTLKRLRPDRSPALRTVVDGILRCGDFLLEDK